MAPRTPGALIPVAPVPPLGLAAAVPNSRPRFTRGPVVPPTGLGLVVREVPLLPRVGAGGECVRRIGPRAPQVAREAPPRAGSLPVVPPVSRGPALFGGFGAPTPG